ncbi:hypothetical protein LQG66_28250 [Bradyrhizobium ontarionense]|uniref:Uncharacterized protein n=1 Tax=Bradyrhizobium ontarionense TaxID=2898149 RepID=A0ABY3R865_9BRAD|nr:hypothetical protein [Bradyrhizobium sp. A19]UFZ03105.1 hypothetical protein LQG66_28250 [Bradyrhizobium sp. A19]
MLLLTGQRPATLRRSRLLASLVSIAFAFSAVAAWAQSAPAIGLRESPPPQQAPAVDVAPPRSNPGLVEELGKLFDKMSIIPLKRPGETSLAPPAGAPGDTAGPRDDAADRPAGTTDKPAEPSAGEGSKGVLKETGDALSRLAKPSSMISGRSVCPVATNGTPDCKLGADRLCQGKGYKEGKSLNTDSAESCSAKVLIPGRQRKPGDCRTDTFVTSALCQ